MRREIKLVRGDQEKGTVLMEEDGTVLVCLEDHEERVCQLAEVPGEETLKTVLDYWRSFGFNLHEVEAYGTGAAAGAGPGEAPGITTSPGPEPGPAPSGGPEENPPQ